MIKQRLLGKRVQTEISVMHLANFRVVEWSLPGAVMLRLGKEERLELR